MDWIKRNLIFVIGAVVAVALMGVAGWYNWSGWSQNTRAREDLNAKYEELKRLNGLKPHPGDGRKVDNIKLAREQQQEIRKFLQRTERRFVPVPAIPDSGTNVTGEEFASALRLTVDQMQRDATNNSVMLPPNFSYSFSAQRQLVRFSGGSLHALAVQLGEVKALCDVLHRAKINSFDSLRRERHSDDDRSGPQTDYLDVPSQTNELAVLTPYEITFRSFSPELAAVLAGFANSPYGIVVKSVNVEPAMAAVLDPNQPPPVVYSPVPTPMAPAIVYPTTPYGRGAGSERSAEAFAERYGMKGNPLMRPPAYPQPQPQVMVAAPPVKTGLQTVLDEKQLNVRMLVEIVKLLPPK